MCVRVSENVCVSVRAHVRVSERLHTCVCECVRACAQISRAEHRIPQEDLKSRKRSGSAFLGRHQGRVPAGLRATAQKSGSSTGLGIVRTKLELS